LRDGCGRRGIWRRPRRHMGGHVLYLGGLSSFRCEGRWCGGERGSPGLRFGLQGYVWTLLTTDPQRLDRKGLERHDTLQNDRLSEDNAVQRSSHSAPRRYHPEHGRPQLLTWTPGLVSSAIASAEDAQNNLHEEPAAPQEIPNEPNVEGGILAAIHPDPGQPSPDVDAGRSQGEPLESLPYDGHDGTHLVLFYSRQFNRKSAISS